VNSQQQAWVPSDEQIGWFGKLPSTGDFLYRRMSREVQSWLDRWLQNGLSAFKRWPDAMTHHYAIAPVWNFAVPATLGVDAVLLGCIAPSCDRVGRYYPVCVSLQLPAAKYQTWMLQGAAQWYWRCGNIMLNAIRHAVASDQFDTQVLAAGRDGFHPVNGESDDILSILDPQAQAQDLRTQQRLGWADLPLHFDALGSTSYWWTNQADGSPLRTSTHGGGLNAPLFSKLFSQGHVPCT
jgi:type VI secretion system protein ImpM